LKLFGLTVLVLAICYVGGYVALRAVATERWEADGQHYVMFPQNQAYLYYLWRPLTYLDAALTGMRFHIGPHQQATL
jgi:hypothetical protein